MKLSDVSKVIEAGQVVWSHFPNYDSVPLSDIREALADLNDQQLSRMCEAVWRLQRFSVQLGDIPFPIASPKAK